MFAVHREILYRILVESPSGAWVMKSPRTAGQNGLKKLCLNTSKEYPPPALS